MPRYYEAEALIEFVKNYSPNINGETTLECVERAIRNAPAADVVPRSEVEKAKQEVAMELINEFEDNIEDIHLCATLTGNIMFHWNTLKAELKKNYIGEKRC